MVVALKIGLGVALLVGGSVMLILGKDSPLEGEGLIMQFVPKRVVGLVAVACAVILFASLASQTAAHWAYAVQRYDEKDHQLQELLSAWFGIPGLLFFTVLMGCITWEAASTRDFWGVLILSLFTLVGAFALMMDAAYLHLVQNPIALLRHI